MNPALGFLPRPGARYLRVGCHVAPRPSKQGPFRWIRQAAVESEYERWTNSRGLTESWQYVLAPLNLQLESGDRLELARATQFELLPAPFEIVEGVFIPPGPYRFAGWVAEAESSEHRALQAGMAVAFGKFYNGRLTQWENNIRWTSPGGRVQLELEAENNFGRLPGTRFIQRLWQTQWTLAWNPNLVLTSFLQYDTESQNVGANTRLRWTLKPGNDLFVVWNRGWQR